MGSAVSWWECELVCQLTRISLIWFLKCSKLNVGVPETISHCENLQVGKLNCKTEAAVVLSSPVWIDILGIRVYNSPGKRAPANGSGSREHMRINIFVSLCPILRGETHNPWFELIFWRSMSTIHPESPSPSQQQWIWAKISFRKITLTTEQMKIEIYFTTLVL